MTQSARIETRTARIDDLPRLCAVWRKSFDDGDYARFFLQNRFDPQNTLVCTADGVVVSQLFLLPVSLRAGDRTVPAYYLFAAATDPAYRHQGYMASLLRAAEIHAVQNGVKAIALMPGTAQLYAYYARFGYRKAFFRRQLSCTRAELQALSLPSGGHEADAVTFLRDYLSGRDGLEWDEAALRYALLEHHRFRGRTACADGAFVSDGEGEAAILAPPDAVPRGFSLLLKISSADAFSVTLPPDAPYGTLCDGGMVCFVDAEIPMDNAVLAFPME